jgi:hypothetical protein
MFGIFETSAFHKSRSFDGIEFQTMDEAEAWVREKLAGKLVCFERDEENNDAADFYTTMNTLYQIERI